MKWFVNLKISTKLISSFLVIALIVTGIGLYSLSNLSTMSTNMNVLYQNNLISIKTLSGAEVNYQKLRAVLRDVGNASTKAEKEKAAASIPDLITDVNKQMDGYRATPLTQPEREMLQTFDTVWPKYQKLYADAQQLAMQENREAFLAALTQLADQGSKVASALDGLIDLNVKLASDQNEESIHDYTTARNLTLVVIAVAVLLSICLGYVIAQMIARPIHKMVAVVSRVSAGDLRETLEVKRTDEIGLLANSINAMVQALRTVLLEVSQSSNQLAASAEQLSASAEQTSQATEHIAVITEQMAEGASLQVDKVEESAQTIQHVSDNIKQIAAHALSVAETSTLALDKSSEGGRAIQTAVGQMNSISGTVEGLAQVIHQLADTSQEIGQITEVITQIAEQTHLLSLNAAIEAARAGEQGRGFAVVANEVQKLAEQSSRSAEKIAKLIHAIREEIETAQGSMQSATAEVRVGREVVHTAGSLFSVIERFVEEVSSQVQEVSASAQLISASTTQVVQSMEGIASVAQTAASGTQNVSAATEEQLATMEEITSSSSALTVMAEELQVVVDKFKL